MQQADTEQLQVTSAAESLAMVKQVLSNTAGPARDIVALNSGAAIYIAGQAETHQAGVAKALEIIADGSAARKLDELVACSNSQ